MANFKRCWELSLTLDSKTKTYKETLDNETSLKIDFNVNSAIGGTFSNGDISIWGLENQDVAFLSTNFNLTTGALKPSSVSLSVGYSDNLSLILKGNILSTDPDLNNPDVGVRMQIMTALENNLQNKIIKDSISGNADFKTICNNCAKNNDLTLDFDSNVENAKIGDYAFIGTPFQQIEDLRKYAPNSVSIFIQNSSLVVSSLKTKGNKKLTLSAGTGLIGSPKPTQYGIEVTSMLNPSLKVGDIIGLKSAKISQIDGDYKIFSINHKGTNRGDLWVSELFLRGADG